MGTMHEIRVMDHTGDTKTEWDTDNPAEVEVARQTFKALRKKGYLIYAVRGNGARGEQMNEFDPEAGKLIATPALVGG